MAEGPLNPPILGDFEFMLPQSWGLGGLKKTPLRRQYFQVLNSPAASILGDFEFMLPQNWGLGGLECLPKLTIFPNVKFASSIFFKGDLGGSRHLSQPVSRSVYTVDLLKESWGDP